MYWFGVPGLSLNSSTARLNEVGTGMAGPGSSGLRQFGLPRRFVMTSLSFIGGSPWGMSRLPGSRVARSRPFLQFTTLTYVIMLSEVIMATALEATQAVSAEILETRGFQSLAVNQAIGQLLGQRRPTDVTLRGQIYRDN